QVLNRALAEGGFANDHATARVLDGPGKNFRRRGAVPVNEHAQRAVPGHARLVVRFQVDLAVRIAQPDHWAGGDDQPGDGGGFDQGAAAVAAQVNDQRVHVFLLAFGNQLAHIAGAGTIVGLVARAALEVDGEHRHADDAHAAHIIAVAVARQFDDVAAGGLFFELDLVALQLDDFGRAAQPGFGRQNLQPDNGAALAANFFNHIVEPPADDVGDFTVLALADANH